MSLVRLKGFEPLTHGLEGRCFYPAELQAQVLHQRSGASAVNPLTIKNIIIMSFVSCQPSAYRAFSLLIFAFSYLDKFNPAVSASASVFFHQRFLVIGLTSHQFP